MGVVFHDRGGDPSTVHEENGDRGTGGRDRRVDLSETHGATQGGGVPARGDPAHDAVGVTVHDLAGLGGHNRAVVWLESHQNGQVGSFVGGFELG